MRKTLTPKKKIRLNELRKLKKEKTISASERLELKELEHEKKARKLANQLIQYMELDNSLVD